MARPMKSGLDYFPFDVDFFSDKKIKILKSRYGTDGVTLYMYLLCLIYKDGFYLKFDDDFEYIISDDLNMGCDKVKQVINFLLERSLFNNILFKSDKVLTSAGIQRRYQLGVKTRASKNPIVIDNFWLLEEEETEAFIKVSCFQSKSEKNQSKSEKNQNKSKNNDTKENKVKESKVDKEYFANKELNETFLFYIEFRKEVKAKMTNRAIELALMKLDKMASKDSEKIAILNQSITNGWKGLFEVKEDFRAGKTSAINNNKFNNFRQREYDMDELEKKLLNHK